MKSENKTLKLLSIDLGFSALKLAYTNNDGALQYEKIVSGIAKLPEKPLEMDDFSLFQFNGEYFLLGNSSLKVPRSYLLNLEDYQQLKESYPIWISYLVKRFETRGLKFDKIIIGLSLAFKDKADELLDYLYETLMWPRESNMFICLPQGLSGKVSYNNHGLSLRETSSEPRLLNFLLVDGGMSTLDVVNISSGGNAAGSAKGYPDTGVIVIARWIKEYLFKVYEIQVSTKEALTIFDNDGIFTKRGKKYDISEKVSDFTRKYLSEVLKLIEEKNGEDLDVVSGIVFIGGITHLWKKYLTDDVMLKEISKHFAPSFIHVPDDGEFYNAAAYLEIVQYLIETGKLS